MLLGKLNQDTINDLDFAATWESEIKTGKSYCLTCNFFPVCGGACPKSWMEGNIPCPSFKYNMPERLRLYYDTIKKAKTHGR
ncbi:SPASM domain-containing protein [Chryseobacterium wanjuense]